MRSESFESRELARQASNSPRDGFIHSGSVLLHYLDWDGAGLPLFFLHGFGLTAHTWDAVCGSLAPEFRCIALDLRGHGDSEWSADGSYPLEDRLADIRAMVADLRLGPFVLVGHSMSGLHAIAYAADRSESLASLAIVDTGPRLAPRSGSRRIDDLVRADPYGDSVDEFVERAMRSQPQRDRDSVRRALLQSLRQMPDGRWTWKYDRRFLDSSRTAPADFEKTQELVRAQFGAVGCPTLVIRGGRSDLFLEEDALAMIPLLRNGRLVTIPDAGHTVQGAQPRAFAETLRTFLKDDVRSG